MSKIIFLITLIISVCEFSTHISQLDHDGISAASGNSTDSTGAVSYCVGQLVNSLATGITESTSLCIQQPHKINFIFGFNNIYGIELLKAYPNPESTLVIFNIKNNELSAFHTNCTIAAVQLLKPQKHSVSKLQS